MVLFQTPSNQKPHFPILSTESPPTPSTSKMAEDKEQSFVESVKEKITETFDDSSFDSDNEAKKKSSSSSAAAEVVDDVKDKVY
ncbi:hypothetical protein Tco_0029434, partial [Tanacetum coccineum]